jgi:hypothetical protein
MSTKEMKLFSPDEYVWRVEEPMAKARNVCACATSSG